MLDLTELARREERRVARSISEVARERRAVAGGGFLCRGVPGTWVNVGVGMGLEGPVPEGAVDELIEWFVGKGIEPRVEFAPCADASFTDALAARGFVIRQFENVFFRELAAAIGPVRVDPSVSIEVLDTSNAAAVAEYAQVISGAFAVGRAATAEEVALTARCVMHPHAVSFAARMDGPHGRVVGGGSIELHDDIGALFGLSVAPEYRRRGIQGAIIASRLELARERGVPMVTISARPGVATERNARRVGFQVGYTKVVVIRPGPGLATVVC